LSVRTHHSCWFSVKLGKESYGQMAGHKGPLILL